MEKYVFGEAGVRNLVQGIVLLFIAVIIIIFAYSSFYGKFYPFTEPIYIEDPGPTLRFILFFGLGSLFFGLWSGVEIGRYVQTKFTKRREQRLKST